MSEQEIVYRPSAWQQRFHALTTNEALGAGDLALDTIVQTPLGPRPIAEIQPGDEVFSADGKACNVIGTQDVLGRCYRLTFDDGNQVVAGENHLWVTWSHLERKAKLRSDRPLEARDAVQPSIRTTAEIARTLKHGKNTNHAIWNADPVDCAPQPLRISAWLIGQWLANGSKNLGKGFVINSPEPEVAARIERYAGNWWLDFRNSPGHGKCRELSISGARGKPNALVLEMRQLFPGDPKNYRIPECYLLGSAQQRWELLRGIVDGDGHVSPLGVVQISFSNRGMTDDVFRLVSSLGFKPTRSEYTNRNPRTKAVTSTQYRVCFSAMGAHVATVQRKQAGVSGGMTRTSNRRYIVDAVEVESVPTKCLTVDSVSRTFLITESFIPTHNSAGPGKSLCLLMEPLSQIQVEHDRCMGFTRFEGVLGERIKSNPLKWGNSTGWALHLRRTSNMLDETVNRSRRIFPAIDPQARFVSDGPHGGTWIFRSGYRYQFGHCKDPGSWDLYMSREFSIILYDELVQFDLEQYEQINTRLRSSDPVLMYMLKIRAMSNPMMKFDGGGASFVVRNPFWVRDHFVKPHPPGKRVLVKKLKRKDGTKFTHTRVYLPATLDDNPDRAFREQYEQTLLNAKPHIRHALLYGDWFVTAGSFFGEAWLKHIHVVRPFDIPPYWPQFRSMDWGFKAPGRVHWWAMDPEGNLICRRELRFQGKHDIEVALIIRDIELDLGLWKGKRSLITGPADTQLWEQRGDSAKSKAQAMAEKGVGWLKADKSPGSRKSGAQLLMKRLDDHDHGTKTPGIVFFDTCHSAISTIPSIPSDPNDPECPMDGGDDHDLDNARYACTFASHGRLGIPSRRKDDDEASDEERQERHNRGRFGYGSRVA